MVQVVDAYECQNVVTIIMELCHGGELYDSLISSQTYSEEVRGRFRCRLHHAFALCFPVSRNRVP